MRLVAFALAAALASCAGMFVRPTPPDPVTIADVSIYLAQRRCLDGSPPHMCAAPVAQKASDRMFFRYMDWPAPGYVVGESVAADGHYVTTWAQGPGPFNAARGDGGEVYVSDGTKVRIAATQDGGTPGIQRFHMWGLFDNKTPQGLWRSIDPLARARRETVTFPASGYGLTEIVADTIISEHYDLPGYGGKKVERSYMVDGRRAWVVFIEPGTFPILPDLAQRCPAGPLTAPPDIHPDWVLYDCRIMTRLVPADGSMNVNGFGWPPIGFVP